jgi:D-serine deaminase-like pyridoxal phosphate-dependent protein
VNDLPTPYLCVDLDVLDCNVSRMAALAAALGVGLRPHAKTHKCLQIARRQLDAGAVGLTVATVGEAEVFTAGGCTDVFIAYPLWVDSARGARLRALAERAAVRVGVDSAAGAAQLARHAGTAVQVLVEVDSGHHRSGVAPEAVLDIAAGAERAGLAVRGVFTFPGHGYDPARRAEAASQEAAALRTAAETLRANGFGAEVVSGGSTPTAAITDGSALTELRPGVYVFNDAQQVELGAYQTADVALTAVATVVSHADGHMILDAGSKVLGADRQPWATGFGRLPLIPEARVTALSEHHATVVLPPGAAVPSLGSRVAVIPNHVCTAVNLADELVITRAGAVVDVWPVAARGANT